MPEHIIKIVTPESEAADLEEFRLKLERQLEGARRRLSWLFDTDHSTPCPK